MDKRKEIIKKVLACLPVLLFLACGAAKDETGIAHLLDVQESGASGQALASGADGGLSATGQTETVPAAAGTVFVHICGEVRSPGVYEVPEGSRICDVLLLAGGFAEGASQDYVNLALPVEDGMQIIVPTAAEAEVQRLQAEAEESGLVNLNTASAAQLCALPGIGESRAADIIAYREAHGGFKAPEEIMQVSGIKEGMYEKIKDMICVK